MIGGALLEGTLIDRRYRVLKRLGQGGMGMVYLANVEGPAGFQKLVALKVVHAHVAHDAQVIEMFLSEARLSAQLSHANIAQIYDLGEADDVHYLSMEYVRGRDLRALVKAVDEHEGRIPLPLCVFIVSKLCEALEHAHELRDRDGALLNLVHRDVTPVNCLLGYAGEVKLIDFGIAKAANIVSSTRAGMIRGKLMYMSPEQTWGHPLDRRSDIFALGIILYELLIGARPFDLQDDNELHLIDRIRSGTHPRAAELDPEVPPELDRIVERALAVDREQRYQAAGEMYEDLQRFLISQQIHVSGKDLGAFLIEMVGVEAARSDGAAPAELTSQTSLKRTPEGKSELRSRVITQPDRDKVGGDLPTRDHAPQKKGAAAARETEADLMPVGAQPGQTQPGQTLPGETLSGFDATERQAPLTGARPRSSPAMPTVNDRAGITRATPQPAIDRLPTEHIPASLVRQTNSRRASTQPDKGAVANQTVIVSFASVIPTETVPEEVARRAGVRALKAASRRPSTSPVGPAETGSETVHPERSRGTTFASSGNRSDPSTPLGANGPAVAPRRSPALRVALVFSVLALAGGAAWWATHSAPPAEPRAELDEGLDAGPLEERVAVAEPVVAPVVEPPRPPQDPEPVPDAGLVGVAEPEVRPEPKPRADKPRKVADKPKPAPPKPEEPEPLPLPLPVVSAYVTVKANQRSEVFVDGRSIGETPRLRVPLRPGKHTLRVDCLYPSGRQQGDTKDLELPPWGEAAVTHACVESKP